MYEEYSDDNRYAERENQSQGFGIASLVLGILALMLFCTCINIPLAIIGIIFGIIQLTRRNRKKGMAIAGIVTSALSLLLYLVCIIFLIKSTDFSGSYIPNFGNDFGDEYFEEFFLPYDEGNDVDETI